MKLLLDEMLSPRIAVELRARGFDVIAVAETRELRQCPDDELFERAQTESRVIVTRNIQDFRPLGFSAIERGDHHAGLILISNRRFPGQDSQTTGALTSALLRALNSTENLSDSEHWLT